MMSFGTKGNRNDYEYDELADEVFKLYTYQFVYI